MHDSNPTTKIVADSERLLEAALDLHRRGLPMTLCVGKKPLGAGWSKLTLGKAWQRHQWTVAEIQRAFQVRGVLNVGLRLGPESRIIDIEPDNADEERAVLELFGGDVPVTPTFASRRGKHRLFRWDERLAETGKGIVDYRGLGIRIGADGKAAQSIIPPSIADGVRREWQVSLDDCDPAPLSDGVIRRIIAENRRFTQTPTDANGCAKTAASSTVAPPLLLESAECAESSGLSESSVCSVYHCVPRTLEQDIQETIPSTSGERNRQIFEFARRLKAVPELASADVRTLRPLAKQWHEAALPYMGTKPFTDTWLDFAKAWDRVKYPAGQEPIAVSYRNALANPLPNAAEPYEEPQLRLLVAWCRELQRIAGGEPFFLDCRTAGKQLDVPHTTANRWLQVLTLDKVLERVCVGTRGKASEYRYWGD